MKFPKSRETVFAVLRTANDKIEEEQAVRSAVIGVFSSIDECDDFRGKCEQEWLEKIGHLDGVEFINYLTTFYG